MATAPDSITAPARTPIPSVRRPRGGIGQAIAGIWAGIEADAAVWRQALGTLYAPAPR